MLKLFYVDQRSCSALRHWYSSKFEGNGPAYSPSGDGPTSTIVSLNEVENGIGSSLDLENRVDEVLLMMGLEMFADTIIGEYKCVFIMNAKFICVYRCSYFA